MPLFFKVSSPEVNSPEVISPEVISLEVNYASSTFGPHADRIAGEF